MDILDLLVARTEEVLTGKYYAKRPQRTSNGYEVFKYDIVNASEKVFASLLTNLEENLTTSIIKSDDNCGFKVGGYVTTQDGEFWKITGIVEKPYREENKQSARLMKKTAGIEYFLRLIKVDNPFEL